MILINKNKKISFQKCNGGYSLIELLFYIALFSILSLMVINSMSVMTKAFKETNIQANLMQGGDIMERISREVRRASGISSISGSFLKLNTTDDAGVPKTISFSLSGTSLQLLENDVFIGNLNTNKIAVSSVSFSQINTVKGLGVKMVLTVMSNDDTNRSESFYDTIVLRGDY